MKIAINGAGIAGPTLAFWLQKSGHEILLIEESARLRTGGYAIDFWGVGYDIAEKMGLIPRLMEVGCRLEELRYVDRNGRKTGGFPIGVLGHLTKDRFIELRRSDLAAALYHAVEGNVEVLFGDSIATIRDEGGRAHVEFDRGGARDFDLVIGADGLHSRVRKLVFGPESKFEVPLGYHVAAFDIEGYPSREELIAVAHATAGRQVMRVKLRGDKTLFLFVFRDECLRGETPSTQDGRKAALKDIFSDVGWECQEILAAMADVPDIYFDRVSQIRMDHWSNGRTVLVGDAAACVSLLAGEGTGLAMTEAYVLAGELHRCGSDHVSAFSNYESRLKPFLMKKQKAAVKLAPSFAPKTTLGVALRDNVSRLMQIPFVANFLFGQAIRDEIALPQFSYQQD